MTVGQDRHDDRGQDERRTARIADEQAGDDEQDGHASADQGEHRQHVAKLHFIKVHRVQEQDEIGGEQHRMEWPGPGATDRSKAGSEPVHAPSPGMPSSRVASGALGGDVVIPRG